MLQYQFRPIDEWPGDKAKSRRHSQFRAKWSDTLDLLERELGHLRARDVVIQAAVSFDDIRNDGMLRSTARPSWPGVILSFGSKIGELSYPCDTYTDWQANVRAIALALEALRAVERFGVTRKAEQYKGWARLPFSNLNTSPQSVIEAASLLVKVGGGDSALIATKHDEMMRVYHRACLATHPDRYPEHADTFKKVQAAKEVIEQHLKSAV